MKPNSGLVEEGLGMINGYSALTVRAAEKGGASVLHLVRDGAEASLCGVPRTSLGPSAGGDERVCPDCIGWLPRRMAATGVFRKPRRI